jgi:hypothetical protein
MVNTSQHPIESEQNLIRVQYRLPGVVRYQTITGRAKRPFSRYPMVTRSRDRRTEQPSKEPNVKLMLISRGIDTLPGEAVVST